MIQGILYVYSKSWQFGECRYFAIHFCNNSNHQKHIIIIWVCITFCRVPRWPQTLLLFIIIIIKYETSGNCADGCFPTALGRQPTFNDTSILRIISFSHHYARLSVGIWSKFWWPDASFWHQPVTDYGRDKRDISFDKWLLVVHGKFCIVLNHGFQPLRAMACQEKMCSST